MDFKRKEELLNILSKHTYADYYILVSKYGISTEELIEFLLSMGEDMINDGMFDGWKDIEMTIWNTLCDKYERTNKFYNYRYGKDDKDVVRNFLLNLNKTNHSHLDITLSHRRGFEWFFCKLDGYTIESIHAYINSLEGHWGTHKGIVYPKDDSTNINLIPFYNIKNRYKNVINLKYK